MPHTLLFTLVGRSPGPVVAAIRHHRPERVWFLTSQDTQSVLDAEILPQVADLLRPGQWDSHAVDNPENFAQCIADFSRFQSEVLRWSTRPEAAVAVDFTGGTKCMTGALVFVARRWDCQFSYTGGTQRDAQGRVVNGAEQVQVSHNPFHELGLGSLETATTLFDAGLADAAARICEVARDRASAARRRAFQTLLELTQGYAAWDRFDHRQAAAHLEQARRNFADLQWLFPHAADALQAALTAHQSWLQRCDRQLSRTLLLDLVANAQRAMALGRYDDATARLYRAAELLAQLGLAATGVLDPQRPVVRLSQLPTAIQPHWQQRAVDDVLRLGLQDDYLLLAQLGQPLGQQFQQLELNNPQRSCFETRNQSILAHGTSPVGQRGCDHVLQAVLQLAALRPDELPPPFPKLGHP